MSDCSESSLNCVHITLDLSAVDTPAVQLLLEMQSRANAAGQCPPPSSDGSVASALATLNQAIEIDALRSARTSSDNIETLNSAIPSPVTSQSLSRLTQARKSASLSQISTTSKKSARGAKNTKGATRSSSAHILPAISPKPAQNAVPFALTKVNPGAKSQPIIFIMPNASPSNRVLNVVQLPKLPVLAPATQAAPTCSPIVTPVDPSVSKRKYVTIMQKPPQLNVVKSDAYVTTNVAQPITSNIFVQSSTTASDTLADFLPESDSIPTTVEDVEQQNDDALLVAHGFDVIFKKIHDNLELMRASAVRVTRASKSTSDLYWNCFKTRFNEIVRDVIHFAKKIPTFSTLELPDQVNLIKGGCFEVSSARSFSLFVASLLMCCYFGNIAAGCMRRSLCIHRRPRRTRLPSNDKCQCCPEVGADQLLASR